VGAETKRRQNYSGAMAGTMRLPYCSADDAARGTPTLASLMFSRSDGKRSPRARPDDFANLSPHPANPLASRPAPKTPHCCESCGEEVTFGRGVLASLCCESCGVVVAEQASDVVVSAGSRTILAVRLTGGNSEMTARIQRMIGSGSTGASASELAASILGELARRGSDLPFSAPAVTRTACRYLTTILSAATTARPSPHQIEELLAGCLHYAAILHDVPVGRRVLTEYVAAAPDVVETEYGVAGLSKPTGVEKSVGLVHQRMAGLKIDDKLPDRDAQSRNSARSVLVPYVDLLDSCRETDCPSGLASVWGWARDSVAACFPDVPVTGLADSLGPLVWHLGRVVQSCLDFAQVRSLGVDRIPATQRAAFAVLILEAFAAMGITPPIRPPARTKNPGESIPLLRDAKYAPGSAEFTVPAEASPLVVATATLQLAVATATTYSVGVLRKSRRRRNEAATVRPFPPKGKLLAIGPGSPSAAVSTFTCELRAYRRDLNRHVLIPHGLYLPRESFWCARGMRRIGAQG